MKKFLFQSIFFLSVISARAQERLSADRPDATEGATLTPKRYFQAEVGLGAVNINDDDFYITHPDALFKYGISKRFELQFIAEYLSLYEKYIPSTKTTRGFTPCMIGFRAALWEEKKIIPKTSVIVRAGFPFLASKTFRPDHAQAVVLLAMENTITDKIGLGYNVGPVWDGFNTTPGWFYSLSSQFDLGKRWDFFLEVFGSAQKNALAQNSIDTGLGFYINNDVKLDGYFGVGITDDSPKNFFGVGFSFRFH
jgi:hypothetical protein